MRSTPLYLMALIVAIARTPLDIYQICARSHGTVKTEPWRSKALTDLLAPLQALSRRVREWCRASGVSWQTAALTAGVLLAVLLVVPHVHANVLMAIPPAAGLKGFRQRDVELKAEIVKATKDRAAIGETAMKESRAMTAEEKAAFLAFGPKIEGLQAQIDENAELLQAAEAANEAERTFQPTRPTVSDADADAASRAAAAAGLHNPRAVVVDKPKQGFFGRQLQAVRNFAINGGAAHTSADDMAILKPIMAGATGMNTDVPSEGGFLVAPERSTTIIQRAYDIGQVLSRINRMPIGANSNGMKLPAIDETSRADSSRYGGIVSGWLGQGNTLTSGKPKFREMDLKLRKVGAFVYATDEQLADSVALEAWINKYLPLELQFRTEDAIVNGLGGNQPLGVMQSPAVITVTRAGASHVTYDDVSGMWKRMWAPLRSNAVWLVDQSVEQDLEQLNFVIGTGGVLAPIYKPAGSRPGQVYAELYGRPIIPVEYCAALGTSGDIILVNFDEYTAIDKGGVDQAVSLHVAFLTDEAVYRFMYRIDGQLSWNAALTPKSGGATLSPVVILS